MRENLIARLLTDEYAERILVATYYNHMSAQELSEKYDIPIAACYRRIHELERLGLIKCEKEITGEKVPMVFERYLRPGDYELALRLEDLNAEAYFGLRQPIEVPLADGAPRAEPEDEETRMLLAEANAAIATGATTLRIVPPRTQLQTGMRRIDTISTGDDIDTVTFVLDKKTILKKTAPPWNVELDFGSLPRMRTLVAIAHDASGREVARDELVLNTGSQRFAVRLTEPRRGVRYRDSLRAEAVLDVAAGGRG